MSSGRGRGALGRLVEVVAGLVLTTVSVGVIVQSRGALDQIGLVGVTVGVSVTVHGALGTSDR